MLNMPPAGATLSITEFSLIYVYFLLWLLCVAYSLLFTYFLYSFYQNFRWIKMYTCTCIYFLTADELLVSFCCCQSPLCPIHTADATRQLSRVGVGFSRRCICRCLSRPRVSVQIRRHHSQARRVVSRRWVRRTWFGIPVSRQPGR